MVEKKAQKDMKSTRWAITVYEGQYPILDSIRQEGHDLVADIGWQDEICPETQRKHRQGYIRTVRTVRWNQARTIVPGAHIEVAEDWNRLVNYCRKKESRDPSGEQVHVSFERPMRLHEMLIEVAREYLLWHGPSSQRPIRIDRQTDRQTLLRYLRDYSHHMVDDRPEYGVVLSRQDARDSWCNYIEVWIKKASEGGGEGQ